MRTRIPLLLAMLSGPYTVAADEPAPDFSTQVAPILTRYCAGCHNDSDLEADFSLESFASLQKGTSDGPALLPGDAANSRIIRVVTGADEPKMPPEDEPQPGDGDIAVLRAWIDAGAVGPDGTEPEHRLIVPRIESHVDVRPISAVDWSADGSLIAVGRYGEVTLHAVSADGSFNPEPTATLGPFPGKVNAVHFIRNDSQVLTASGTSGLVGEAAIWNAADGTLLHRFEGHRDTMYDAELSPDGALLATCSYDRQIILWNADTGEQVRTLAGHNGAVFDVAFNNDGTVLSSASADETCKVWRVSDGERLDTLSQPTGEQYAVAFSPNGRFIIAGGADNRIRVWRFVSRERPRINPLMHARFAHEGPIVALQFTPDGRGLVSVAEDRTVKLWETRNYTELKLFEQQPSVAMALAVSGSGAGFLLGRMDGSLQSYAVDLAVAAPESGTGGTVVATAPMGDMGEPHELAEQEPNDTPAQTASVTPPARITGTIHTPPGDNGETALPDSDLFRFTARAGQQWVIEINAARSKSPLDSFIEVLDSDGRPIERALLQAVRDSYFTFRGKNADTADDFRVFNWQEMDLNQYLYANGEVVKLWLYPRGPDSGFMVYPGKGKRWGWFDTTPLSHPLGEPCYIVEAYPPGTELIPNGLPEFKLYYQNDDDARRELGQDSRLTFTAPADGDYLVHLRDVRGFQGPDYSYTLDIRPRRPDFQVTLHGANPEVSPGSGKEFRVEAKRVDGYEGPIRVDIAGLPPGFHASTPVTIEEGQIEALGVIWADADAPQPTDENKSATTVTATATITDADVSHDVNNLGEIKLAEPAKLLVAIEPAENGAQSIGTTDDGLLEFAITPGETIMLQVRVERIEFDNRVAFGKEGAGRNLPFGSFVDNLGLNGLLVVEGQNQREFFVYAAPWVPAQTRMFHLNTSDAGGQASRPVLLHVRGADELAGR